MKLGEAMYQANQDDAEAEAGGEADAEAGADDDVVDADFEEVQDDEPKKSA